MRTFDRSRALLERARRSLAGGVSSPVRGTAPVPLYFARGVGPRLQDADGNWYIDYAAAWGPVILGYSHPALVAAAHGAAERPFTYGAQHELEISVAERIQAVVPSAERVAFSSSGSEVVQLVHRLARAFTRRNLILKFEGHYHGWIDGALGELPPARGARPPGVAERHPRLLRTGPQRRRERAGRALERPRDPRKALPDPPGPDRRGDDGARALQQRLPHAGAGYLEGVRVLCRRHGTLFIMDEVITGFRIALGGAQAHFGVTPISRRSARRWPAARRCPSWPAAARSWSSSTARASPSAALSTATRCPSGSRTRRWRSSPGTAAPPSSRPTRTGQALMEGSASAPIGTVSRFSSPDSERLHGPLHQAIEFRDYRDTLDDDAELLDGFLRGALEEGLHVLPDGRFYVSAVHAAAEVEETLGIVDRVFATLGAPARRGDRATASRS